MGQRATGLGLKHIRSHVFSDIIRCLQFLTSFTVFALLNTETGRAYRWLFLQKLKVGFCGTTYSHQILFLARKKNNKLLACHCPLNLLWLKQSILLNGNGRIKAHFYQFRVRMTNFCKAFIWGFVFSACSAAKDSIGTLLKNSNKNYREEVSSNLFAVSKLEMIQSTLLHLRNSSRMGRYVEVLQSLKINMCESLLEIKTCRRESFTKRTLGGKICIQASTLSPTEDMPDIFTILAKYSFYLNISFSEFRLHSRADHVNLVSQFPSDFQHHYVFCGVRHPWVLIHTSHTAILELHLSTSYTLHIGFQIFVLETLSRFEHCPYDDPCSWEYSCRNQTVEQELKRQMQGYQWMFVSHRIQFGHKDSLVVVFHVAVTKYRRLKISCTTNFEDVFLAIHDGPSLASKTVKMDSSELIMQFFQATMACQAGQLKVSQVHFHSIARTNDTTADVFDKTQKFYFHPGTPDSDDAVLETMWLRKPKNNSLNVTIESVEYRGPDEGRHINLYGAICVYLIDQSGDSEEVLCISHTMSRHTDNSFIQDKRKHYGIVTRNTTQHLVLVHYFYPQFSFIKGTVLVSHTVCVGIYSSGKESTEIRQLLDFLSPQCLVVTIVPRICNFTNVAECGNSWPEQLSKEKAKRPWFHKNNILFHANEYTFAALQAEVNLFVYRMYGIASTAIMFERRFFDKQQTSTTIPLKHHRIEPHLEADKLFHTVSYDKLMYSTKGYKKGQIDFSYCAELGCFLKLCRNTQNINTKLRGSAGRTPLKNRCAHLYFDGWITLTVQLFHCGRFTPPVFLPVVVFFEEWKTHCAADIYNFSAVRFHLQKAGYSVLKQLPKSVPVETPQYVVSMPMSESIHCMNSYSAGLYLNLKDLGTSDNARITIAPHFVPGSKPFTGQLTVSTDSNVLIPTFLMCRLSPIHISSSCVYKKVRCAHNIVIMPKRFLHVLEKKVSVQKDTFSLKRFHAKCTGQNCRDRLVSWSEAERTCESKGMHLPSVHSTRDMHNIRAEVLKNEEQFFKSAQRDPRSIACSEARPRLRHAVFCYQTVGIFIGAKSKVSISPHRDEGGSHE